MIRRLHRSYIGILSIALCFYISPVDGRDQVDIGYIEECQLSPTVVKFQFDPKSNLFGRKEDDDNEKKVRTLLRSTSSSSSSSTSSSSSSSSSSSPPVSTRKQLNKDEKKDDDFISNARECRCASIRRNSTTYCFTKHNENFCRVPNSIDHAVQCFETTKYTEFIKSVWPLSILWITGLLIYLIMTETGRSTLKYALSKVCLCAGGDAFGNTRLIETIISRETAMMNIQQIASLTSSVQQQALSNRGTTFILKTKHYTSGRKKNIESNEGREIKMVDYVDKGILESPSNDTMLTSPESFSSATSCGEGITTQPSSEDDGFQCLPCSPCDDPYVANDEDEDEDEDEVMCTICMVDIEDGDRIGALPCDHLFHVDCLKEWIQRRNVCPLCQEPIAEEKSKPDNDTSPRLAVRYPAFTVRTTGSPVERPQRRRTRQRGDHSGRQLFYVNNDGRIPPRLSNAAGVTVINTRSNGNVQQHRILVGDAASFTPSTRASRMRNRLSR